jgi:hypothetical protein
VRRKKQEESVEGEEREFLEVKKEVFLDFSINNPHLTSADFFLFLSILLSLLFIHQINKMRISSCLFPILERRIFVSSSSLATSFASFSFTSLSASPFLSSLSSLSSSFSSFLSLPSSLRLSPDLLQPPLLFLPSRPISFFAKAFEGVGSTTPPKTHSEKRILQYSPQQIYSGRKTMKERERKKERMEEEKEGRT